MNPLYIAALALVVTAGVVAVLCAAAVAFTLAAIHRARLARDLRRSAVADALKHPLVSAGEVAHRGVCLDDPLYDVARGATVTQGHPPRGDSPLGV